MTLLTMRWLKRTSLFAAANRSQFGPPIHAFRRFAVRICSSEVWDETCNERPVMTAIILVIIERNIRLSRCTKKTHFFTLIIVLNSALHCSVLKAMLWIPLVPSMRATFFVFKWVNTWQWSVMFSDLQWVLFFIVYLHDCAKYINGYLLLQLHSGNKSRVH